MVFKINCDIYPSDVLVFVDEKNKGIKKRLRKIDYSNKEISRTLKKIKQSNGRCRMMSDGLVVMILKSDVNDFYSKICHESLHATTFILDRIGVKFKLGVSDEAYAYLIGYISKEIFNKLETNKEK
jgi:hypothetical protein